MKTRLHIDRLVVRTQGVTPAAAEATARAIPRDLAVQLAPRRPSHVTVPSLTVAVTRGDSPHQIARAIAARLANESSA